MQWSLGRQDAALASLKSLSKNDVVEVKSMQKPPAGVRLVIEAVCIMQGVKPKKIAGEKVSVGVNFLDDRVLIRKTWLRVKN